jgi:hypothetical protein
MKHVGYALALTLILSATAGHARETARERSDRARDLATTRAILSQPPPGQTFTSPFGSGQPQRSAPLPRSNGTMTVPNR